MTHYPCRRFGNLILTLVVVTIAFKAFPGWQGPVLAFAAFFGGWLANAVTQRAPEQP